MSEMSESVPQWSQDCPQEPGTYIYTGWTMQRFSPPHFVTVGKVAQNGRIYYVLNKYLLKQEETEGGWWLRVPDPPTGAATDPLDAERLRDTA